MTLRQLLRRIYGIRMKMLQLRTALFAGPDEFDPQAFLWTGRPRAGSPGGTSQDRPSDHVVNVLAAQLGRDGHFDVDRLMKTWNEWTQADADHQSPDSAASAEDAGK